MDIFLIVAIFSVIVLLFLSGFLFVYRPGISNKNADQTMRIGTGNKVEVDRPRRAQIIRNQRSRLRAQDRQEDLDEEPEDSDNEQNDLGDEKIGAKKRAKLEAKAEKKALREVEEKVREEKKKREQQDETERLKALEKEQNEEKKIEEEERLLREERERIEHEAYLKMKASFSIEEEGYEDNDGEERDQSLQKFISYIKDNKVIIIEDLAVMFKLKTQAAIDRIQDLQKDDILSGVMDDRGKYIYISQDELHSFAKFIKQRGRVSLSELAESSNKLINLQPNQIIAS